MAPANKLRVFLLMCALVGTSLGDRMPANVFDVASEYLETVNDILSANNGQPMSRIGQSNNIVAYYAVDGKQNYVIVSNGENAKVFSSGALPGPLKTLNKQANKACETYQMVSLSGLIACLNSNGQYINANLGIDIKEGLKNNGTSIDQYIKDNAEAFIASFDVKSENASPDGKAIEEPEKKEGGFTVREIQAGGTVKFAIGEGVTKITVTYMKVEGDKDEDIPELQEKLCEVVDGCVYTKKESIIPAGKVTKLPGMDQLTLTISSNASKILDGKEAIFEIQSFRRGDSLVKAYYQITFAPDGKGWHEYGSPWLLYERWIPYHGWFPQYVAFYYGNCIVGAAAVTMGNIFGYFDRRSHYRSDIYPVGYMLYGSCFYGNCYPYSPVAPFYYNSDIYVSRWLFYINYLMGYSCSGSIPISSIDDVLAFFRARTRSSAYIEYYYSNSFTSDARSILMNRINQGFPVFILREMSGYWEPGNVIGYKYYYRSVRYCYKTWLFFTKCDSWYYEYIFYMFVQYNGSGAWYSMNIRHFFTPIF